MKMQNNSPILVIGMHRSGTTMITKMLRDMGLFIGNDLEPNAESWFFINHNDWLLRQSGAAWHNPQAVKWLLQNDRVLTLAQEYIRSRMNGLPIHRYLGWRRFLAAQRPLKKMEGPWGWKDPRTTFTLPFWLKLFPNAKVIHIYRNGVPVAGSLRVRDRKGLEVLESKHRLRNKLGLYNVVKKNGGFVNSVRCLTLEGGFTLWEEYVGQALSITDELQERAMSFKYEEFLSNPKDSLSSLSAFCGLQVNEKKLDLISSRVRQARADAYMEDEELRDFYDHVKGTPLMNTLGYSS